MIVFISDLHIGATVALSPAEQAKRKAEAVRLSVRGESVQPLKLQLKAGAVRGFYDDLKRLAKDANAQEVIVALLGDIFDFIQTRAWLDPTTQKPTAFVKGDPSEPQILNVLTEIACDEPVNREFFRALREVNELEVPGWSGTGKGPPVRRVFVPGNHDRLCNAHASVRHKVRDILGIHHVSDAQAEAPFDWQLPDDLRRQYAVLARHGHEFDIQNYV